MNSRSKYICTSSR